MMIRPLSFFAALLLTTAFALPTFAQDWEDPAEDQTPSTEHQPHDTPDDVVIEYDDPHERDGHFLSATVAPLLFFFPALEVMVEFRAVDHLGIALVPLIASFDEGMIYGSSLQGNFYPLREFGGVNIGAEGIFQLATAEHPTDPSVTARGVGVGGGVYLGYKAVASFGLTFVGQLGYNYLRYELSATDGVTTLEETIDNSGLLLRLNLGWTF